jgi:hypothetical protein
MEVLIKKLQKKKNPLERDLDDYVHFLCMAKDDPHPMIVLMSDEQIADIRAQCTSDAQYPSVLCIDRTFNLGSCFVTITVYKNKNLLNAGMT